MGRRGGLGSVKTRSYVTCQNSTGETADHKVDSGDELHRQLGRLAWGAFLSSVVASSHVRLRSWYWLRDAVISQLAGSLHTHFPLSELPRQIILPERRSQRRRARQRDYKRSDLLVACPLRAETRPRIELSEEETESYVRVDLTSCSHSMQ